MYYKHAIAGLVLSFAAATPCLAASSPAEQGLLDAEQQRFQAQIKGDVTALQQDLADELNYVHASGTLETKAQFLQAVRDGKSRYLNIDAVPRTVHVFGNFGLTSGVVAIVIGNGMRLSSYCTGAYILRGGHWQLLSWQSTVGVPHT